MTDWDRVRAQLRAAGYSGFTFDNGETAVPELSGEWVAGEVAREGQLRGENQPLLIRVLDALPGAGGASLADPERAPEPIRDIANRHGLEIVIISVSQDAARIALCDSAERTDR